MGPPRDALRVPSMRRPLDMKLADVSAHTHLRGAPQPTEILQRGQAGGGLSALVFRARAYMKTNQRPAPKQWPLGIVGF